MPRSTTPLDRLADALDGADLTALAAPLVECPACDGGTDLTVAFDCQACDSTGAVTA